MRKALAVPWFQYQQQKKILRNQSLAANDAERARRAVTDKGHAKGARTLVSALRDVSLKMRVAPDGEGQALQRKLAQLQVLVSRSL